jgi:hypothetical protein
VASTSEFLDSFGVNTHFHWRNWEASPYADTAQVAAALDYIHIGRVREALPSLTWLPDAMTVLADAGVEFTLISYGDYFSVADQVAMLRGFAARHPDAIHAVEGPNEPYNWPLHYAGLTGPAAGLAFQTALYNGIRQAPELAGIRVYDVSDLSYTGPADVANFHAYNLQGGPGTPAILAALAPITGGSTENVVLTEIGWGTGRNLISRNVLSGLPAPWESVDEITQARETIKVLSSAFAMGIDETYIYELVDPFPRLTDTDLLWNFGLFNDDWSPKAAARALHAFGSILSDPGTGLASGWSPPPQASWLAGGLQILTLAHHANRTDYIIWDEQNNWDGVNDVAFAAHLSPLTMRFDRPMANILVFDPLQGTAPLAQFSDRGELSLWVGADPLIVSVFQEASSLPSPPAPQESRLAPRTVEIGLFRKDILAVDVQVPVLGGANDADFGVSGWLMTTQGPMTVSAASRLQLLDGTLSFDGNDPAVRIESLFRELLDRPSAPAERLHWSNLWHAQGGFHAVLEGMLAGGEFLTLSGGASQPFVTSLYRDILRREPEQAGLEFWMGALQQGYGRADIARAFYHSAEYTAQIFPTELGLWSTDPLASRVARLYHAALDRAPDQAGLSFWMDLARQGYGFDQIATGFTRSVEAGNRFLGQSDADYVNQLYFSVLDRAPDAGGFAFWNRALADLGWTRDAVLLAFSDSTEFQQNTAAQIADGLLFV